MLLTSRGLQDLLDLDFVDGDKSPLVRCTHRQGTKRDSLHRCTGRRRVWDDIHKETWTNIVFPPCVVADLDPIPARRAWIAVAPDEAWVTLHLSGYAALALVAGDLEGNPALRRPVPWPFDIGGRHVGDPLVPAAEVTLCNNIVVVRG